MSEMAASTSRSSVFTFESTVHSSHVLHRLDEQRSRDTLCDVTVVVEGHSFRAHRSVLASCSEYFTQRISSLTRHGAVVTLPPEVTVAGFEALLKFAYTSKLYFAKENVIHIQNAATVLGFRDLADGCFEFLLPKFFSKSKSSGSPRKAIECEIKCCKKAPKDEGCSESDWPPAADKDSKAAADSFTRQEVIQDHNKLEKSEAGSHANVDTTTPAGDGGNENSSQCPKYRKFQLACEKESCAPDKDCLPPCLSNNTSSNNNDEPECSTSDGFERIKERHEKPEENKMHDVTETCRINVRDEKPMFVSERKEEDDIRAMEKMDHTNSQDANSVETDSPKSDGMLGEWSSKVTLHRRSLKTSNRDNCKSFLRGHGMFDNLIGENKTAQAAAALETSSAPTYVQRECERKWGPSFSQDRGKEEKSFCIETDIHQNDDVKGKSHMEMEMTDLPVMEQRSDKSLVGGNLQNSCCGPSTDMRDMRVERSSSELAKVLMSSNFSRAGCSFNSELEKEEHSWKPAGAWECEGTSQSGLSSVNSGDDGDSETDGDSESSTRERAKQVHLPFPVEKIINLSRNDFHQLLKQYILTREQLDFVHDMRRRTKNRLAAQRCRKRKLDCIYNLQCEINKLKTEREKLILEGSQLSQMKSKTCHNVATLCQRVCREANLQPEQLQVLTKYSSPECPLSSLFPHIDAFLVQHGLPLHLQAPLLKGSSEDLENEDTSSSDKDKATNQHSL